MKQSILIAFTTLIVFFTSCQNNKEAKNISNFRIDTSVVAGAQRRITDNEHNRIGNSHKTFVKGYFYSNDAIVDSVEDYNYLISSYYFWQNDSLFLIASINDFSTSALLAKFYKGSVAINYLRCGHTHSNYKLRRNDKVQDCVEVPCREAELILSHMPDSTRKQDVYGYISLRSEDYYYEHELTGEKKEGIDMRFHFRSRFKDFSSERKAAANSSF